jgi:putative transposase
VTDAVLEEVGRWQSRPLDPLYALVFFDALRVKMRDEGTVRNKAVYVPGDGRVTGGTQGRAGDLDRADRGCEVLAACDDGDQEPRRERHSNRRGGWLEGISGSDQLGIPRDADSELHRAFDQKFAGFLLLEAWKDRKPVAQELKTIYRAKDVDAAAAALHQFEDGPWGKKFAAITALWRRH